MWGNGARAFISHKPVVLGTFLHPCMQPNKRTFVCCVLLQSFGFVEKAHVTDTDLLPRGLTVCTHGAPHCEAFHANSVCHAVSLSKMKEAKQGAQGGAGRRALHKNHPRGLPQEPKKKQALNTTTCNELSKRQGMGTSLWWQMRVSGVEYYRTYENCENR